MLVFRLFFGRPAGRSRKSKAFVPATLLLLLVVVVVAAVVDFIRSH